MTVLEVCTIDGVDRYRFWHTVSDCYFGPSMTRDEAIAVVISWGTCGGRYPAAHTAETAAAWMDRAERVERWSQQVCGYQYDNPVPAEHRDCIYTCSIPEPLK